MRRIKDFFKTYGWWAVITVFLLCVLFVQLINLGRSAIQPSPLHWDRETYDPTPSSACPGEVVRYGPVVLTVSVNGGRLFAGFQGTWVNLDTGAALLAPDGQPLSSTVVRVPFDEDTVLTSTETLTIPAMLEIPARPGWKYTGVADFSHSTGYTVPVTVPEDCP